MVRKRGRRMKTYPLLVRWPDRLPTRTITAPGVPRIPAWFEHHSHASDSMQNANTEPFDFCANMQRLVTDIALRCADYRHLDVPRILMSVTQARETKLQGLQARVTPL